MIDFLFISNGYGEDAIAAKIAQLLSATSRSVAAFPLVGTGKSYAKRGIPVVASFPPLPSAGVSLWDDLKSGLLSLLKNEYQVLKSLRTQVSVAVCVGDIFPVLMEHFGLGKRFAFIGTAKSVLAQPYNFFEYHFIRKTFLTYVRDEKTSQALNARGVKAQYVGNPMMDELEESKIIIPPFDGVTVGLLPGSRQDALFNFQLQVQSLNDLQRYVGKPVRALVAIPPTLPLEELVSCLKSWDGIQSSTEAPGVQAEYTQSAVTISLVQDCLGDLLRASEIVLGQAGTANEQAAGLGKPVIAFDYSRTGKLSWYRWRQKKLLGDALQVVSANPERLGRKAFEVLLNRTQYNAISQEGKNRLGSSGGSAKIAEALSLSYPAS